MCGKGIFLAEEVRQKAVDTASGRLVAVIEMSFTDEDTDMTKNVGKYQLATFAHLAFCHHCVSKSQ